MKYFTQVYELDCRSFQYINQYFDHKRLNTFFRRITHLGGAGYTISTILLLLLISKDSLKMTAIASAISLTISHVPVAVVKKIYPRKRPYLVLVNCRVTDNPLTDCSFPSGHTTAIFSVITPLILYYPLLASVLVPIGVSVGISRVYLGLHYPSDIIVGCLLGIITGIASFLIVNQYAQPMF